MSEIQVFNNPEFGQLRTVMIDNVPWAVGKDVADALGYQNGSRDVTRHVDAEDRMKYQNGTAPILDSMGRVQTPIIINESGLYSLILSSKLPSAKRFKRWVTSEVLPAIRATGAYTAPEKPVLPQRTVTMDDYLRAAQIVAVCKSERLPYVMGLLAKGGITMPEYEPTADTKNGLEAARLINKAYNEYGMSLSEIGRLTGIHKQQISRIRSGQSIPKEPRASLIIQTIKSEIPEIE